MKTRREREREGEKSNYAEVSEDASQMLVCWCKNIRGGKPPSISQTRTEVLELQNQMMRKLEV